MKKCFITLGSLFSSSSAFAAQAPSIDLAATAGSLILVIVLILFFAWILKRMKLPTMTGQKDLKVVRQMSVGTKERVMVIQAGEEQFLVGATSQSIQLISKLEQPIQDDEKKHPAFNSPFAKVLGSKISKKSPVGDVDA